MRKYLISLITIAQLLAAGSVVHAATASVGNYYGEPGDNLTISITVSGFNSVGAIDMHLHFTPGVVDFISFEDPNNIGGFMVEASEIGGNYRVSISWIDPDFHTLTGLDFPDDILLKLQLLYLGGESAIVFPQHLCEVSTMPHLASLNVSYQNGTISPAPWIWNGTVSDDWHDKNNWNKNMEPHAGSEVLIVRSLTHLFDPLISGSAVVSHIQIEGDIALTIGPTGRLTADIINNQSVHASGGIKIAADENDKGSLLNFSPGVIASFELYLNQAGIIWHQVASAVSNMEVADIFGGCAVFTFFEPLSCWVSFQNNTVYPTWSNANNSSTILHPAHGYLVACNEYDNRIVQGILNQGTIGFALSKQANPNSNPGFNLAGNPYPSAIDWKAVTGWGGRHHLQEDGGGYTYWAWNPEYGNYGYYNSGFSNDFGFLGASRYIRPGQGFFVKAETDGGTLTMNDEIRLHMPDLGTKTRSSKPWFALKVNAESIQYIDVLYLEAGHDNTSGVVDKLFSPLAEAPQLYIGFNGSDYSALYLNETQNELLSLHVKAGLPGNHLISLMNAGESIEVWLHDEISALAHNLTAEGAFTVNASSAGQHFEYSLILKKIAGAMNIAKDNLTVFYSNGKIYIDFPEDENYDVYLFDMLGRPVCKYNVNNQGLHAQQINTSTGIYVIRITGATLNYSGKILITD